MTKLNISRLMEQKKIFKNYFDKKINNKGNLFKIINKNSDNFYGFEELYKTSINKNLIKGWKKHEKKTSNLIIIRGKIKIYYSYEEVPKLDKYITISEDSNFSIIIRNNIWFAMKGLFKNNIILNLSNKLNKNAKTFNYTI